MFEELWSHQAAALKDRARSFKTELAKIERQAERVLDKIVEATVPSVVAALENRVRKLDEQKTLVSERIANCGRPVRSFGESLRTALWFLASPSKLWSSEHHDDKRAVLNSLSTTDSPMPEMRGLEPQISPCPSAL